MERREISEREIVDRGTRLLLGALEALNYAILIGLGAALWLGVGWLVAVTNAPISDGEARLYAVAAFLAPNLIAFARGLRRGHVAGNSIRLSEAQIPAIHRILAGHAARIGAPTPELYLSEVALDVDAEAFSAFRCDYVVISPHFLERRPKKSRSVISFMLGRELGRIRLGYTGLRHELGFFYVKRIPVLKTFLAHAKTYVADRYGAWLEPEGLEGLMVVASGRRQLKNVAWEEFVRQVEEEPDLWTRAANALSPTPALAFRARRLLRAGLLVLPEPEVVDAEVDVV